MYQSLYQSSLISVVDGGALFHKFKWPKITYGDVLDPYENYMNIRYSKVANVMVVFNGYSDELSLKVQDCACPSGSSSADKQIKSSKVMTSREAFLANTHNKVQLITMLSARLQAIGFMTEQSKGDAVNWEISYHLRTRWVQCYHCGRRYRYPSIVNEPLQRMNGWHGVWYRYQGKGETIKNLFLAYK